MSVAGAGVIGDATRGAHVIGRAVPGRAPDDPRITEGARVDPRPGRGPFVHVAEHVPQPPVVGPFEADRPCPRATAVSPVPGDGIQDGSLPVARDVQVTRIGGGLRSGAARVLPL